MKRFALAAAVVMLAACGAKEEATPAADTAAAAMTPAPAPAMDSSAMSMDSSMKHDSAADTTMKH